MQINLFLLLFCLLPLWVSALNNISAINEGGETAKMNATRRRYGDPCEFKKTTVKSRFFIAILIFIFAIGLTGNIIAIVIILTSKRLRAMETNIFVAALAACDIGAILFIIPIRLDTYFKDRNFCFDIHVCRMFNFSDLLFHIGSISHLFLIAIERFIAVNYPFFYQRVKSRTRTLMFIALTWLYAALLACLSLFDWETPSKGTYLIYDNRGRRLCLLMNRVFFNVIYIVVYIIPLAVMGVLYASILSVALKQARIIESLSLNVPEDEGRGRRNNKKSRKEVRATKTLAIVYGAFTICWLPITIISITSKWFPMSYRSFNVNHPILAEFVYSLFIEILPALNSCINPFIYILFNRKFRQELTIASNKLLGKSTSPMSLDSSSSMAANTTAATQRSKYFSEAYAENNNKTQFTGGTGWGIKNGTVSPAFTSSSKL